jgi:hypothetical protein
VATARTSAPIQLAVAIERGWISCAILGVVLLLVPAVLPERAAFGFRTPMDSR